MLSPTATASSRLIISSNSLSTASSSSDVNTPLNKSSISYTTHISDLLTSIIFFFLRTFKLIKKQICKPTRFQVFPLMTNLKLSLITFWLMKTYLLLINSFSSFIKDLFNIFNVQHIVDLLQSIISNLQTVQNL